MEGNQLSRYPFAPIGDDGAFFFLSDIGCYYTLEISNKHQKFTDHNVLHNDGDAYEISIQKQCDGEDPYDEAVSVTIIYILGTNIASRGDTAVFFYVCDNTDGNGAIRARKFNIWYYKLKKELTGLQKYNFVVPGYDKEQFNISLLIFENHPAKDEYLKEFEACLSENFAKR